MAENEKLNGIQMEELEALAGEFTLDDLAEFDNEMEFDVSDLEAIKPVYTTKEKMKLIFMNNTVFSIIKWAIAGLGLIGLVLYILAMVSPDISETLTTTVSSAVVGVLTAISNLLPVSLMEILALVTVVGILAYIGFLVYKTIKEKEGIKIVGIWVQLAYVLVAVFAVGFLFYSIGYGVTTNRPMLYKEHLANDGYRPTLFTEQSMDNSMIYFTDKINEVAVDGMDHIYYTAIGHSRYYSTGSSIKEIGEAVNACYEAAAEDYAFLKGKNVKVKKLMLPGLYTMMGIGSIYSPLTGEVLINTDYPEMIAPMQIARAIAKHRGITNDADASFVAFLVCSKYADQLAEAGSTYNMDYIKYAAYMDAYMAVGNVSYLVSADMHLYTAAALKETAKKEIISYVTTLDALYGNVSQLEFQSATQKTATDDYKDLPKLLYVYFNESVNNGDITLSFNTEDNPVRANNIKYFYARYLVNYFAAEEANGWADEAAEVYAEYNPEPLPNDGSVGEETTTEE